MSHQFTFADSEFNGKRRKTRKEIFLARMDALLPWSRMLEVIEPVYPKAGNGRRPYPLDTMAVVQPQRRRHGRCSLRDCLNASGCQTLPGPGHP